MAKKVKRKVGGGLKKNKKVRNGVQAAAAAAEPE